MCQVPQGVLSSIPVLDLCLSGWHFDCATNRMILHKQVTGQVTNHSDKMVVGELLFQDYSYGYIYRPFVNVGKNTPQESLKGCSRCNSYR
jgi:hypothetical protein